MSDTLHQVDEFTAALNAIRGDAVRCRNLVMAADGLDEPTRQRVLAVLNDVAGVIPPTVAYVRRAAALVEDVVHG